MWPWRRRSTFESLHLPKKVFISHSYKDSEVRKQLLQFLPKNVEPYIFPPIVVSPEQMVSNNLIDAILACDGLIYLQGGSSSQSFWVAFERDYALRAGRPVFAYEPTTQTLCRDVSSPLELRAVISYSRRNRERILHTFKIMAEERFFDTWFDNNIMEHGAKWVEGLGDAITQRLEAGGYAVAFWSAEAAQSRWVRDEIDLAVNIDRAHVLFACLDDTALPTGLDDLAQVQLFADALRPELHRIDDLIVRLYWLKYRDTRQSQLS